MGSERRIAVLVVDDHDLMRIGLRALLQSQRDVTVVGEAATAGEAIVQAVRLSPSLVLMETSLPDASGIDACREIRSRVSETRVIMLTEHVDDDSVVASVRAGASGYLSKRVRARDLHRAVRAVAAGESLLDPASMETLLDRIRRDAVPPAGRDIVALAAQERRVLALVAQGKTNKEIAVALGLSEKTVKNYLSHAFEKLNVSRRAHAAVLFSRESVGFGDALRGLMRGELSARGVARL